MIVTSENTKEIFETLINNSGAATVLLISKEGYNVVNSGDISYLNTTALAALVAGMFSATREVALIVGEKQFSILLQQGENRHIHISLIKDTMMVIIFQDYQRIGKVRHEAQKASEKLIALMNAVENVSPGMNDSKLKLETPEFKEYALNLIDRIFNNQEG